MGTMKITNNCGPREFGSKGMATTISVQGPYSSPPNDLVLNPLNSWIYNKPGNSQNDGKKRHIQQSANICSWHCVSHLYFETETLSIRVIDCSLLHRTAQETYFLLIVHLLKHRLPLLKQIKFHSQTKHVYTSPINKIIALFYMIDHP